MTVRELIALLKQFPEGDKVFVLNKTMRDYDFCVLKASRKYNRTYDFTYVVLET